jgi:hypothetical protein
MINVKYLRQHANQVVHINKEKVFFLHKKNLSFPKFILITYPLDLFNKAELVAHKVNYVQKLFYVMMAVLSFFALLKIYERVSFNGAEYLPPLSGADTVMSIFLIIILTLTIRHICHVKRMTLFLHMPDKKILEWHLYQQSIVDYVAVGAIKNAFHNKLPIEEYFT